MRNLLKNNRYVILALVALVGVVWTEVFFRVAEAVGEENSDDVRARPVAWNVTSSDTVKFSLLLNYDDPFLKKKPQRERSVQQLPLEKKLKKEKVVLPEDIRYYGLLQNESKGGTALLFAKNKFHHVRKNEKLEGFEIFFISRDSIGLKQSRFKFYLKR